VSALRECWSVSGAVELARRRATGSPQQTGKSGRKISSTYRLRMEEENAIVVKVDFSGLLNGCAV